MLVTTRTSFAVIVLITVLTAACGGEPAADPSLAPSQSPRKLTGAEKAAVDRITGATGSYTEPEDVYRVTFPRTEVAVAVDGWPFHPFMGITSWAAFTAAGDGQVIVMGDLTLFEDEVNPVMSAALNSGLEVTALHNHFFHDNPKVMFMHIGGHGDVETLATGVRAALDEVAAIRQASAQPARGFPGPIPAQSSISAETINGILDVEGAVSNGMYKATIGRTARMHGREVGGAMGVNTWAAFAGSDENALVDGDFAMHESELQAVLKSLRASGINVVAIHNHMIGDEPRYVFLHYWGKGPASELARALRAALDKLSD